MIIHDVRVEPDREIVVGATDLQRWEWELEDCTHAANAKTLVYIALDNGVTETIGLHVAHVDPHREAAIAAIPELLKAAWEIYDGGWSEGEARSQIVGRRIESVGE